VPCCCHRVAFNDRGYKSFPSGVPTGERSILGIDPRGSHRSRTPRCPGARPASWRFFFGGTSCGGGSRLRVIRPREAAEETLISGKRDVRPRCSSVRRKTEEKQVNKASHLTPPRRAEPVRGDRCHLTPPRPTPPRRAVPVGVTLVT